MPTRPLIVSPRTLVKPRYWSCGPPAVPICPPITLILLPVTLPCLPPLCPTPRLCCPGRRSYPPRLPAVRTLVTSHNTPPTGCVALPASHTAPPGGHTALPAACLPCTPVLPLTLLPRPSVVPSRLPATPPCSPVSQPCPLFVTPRLAFVPSHLLIVLLRPPVMSLCPLITRPLTAGHAALSAACLPERCVVSGHNKTIMTRRCCRE